MRNFTVKIFKLGTGNPAWRCWLLFYKQNLAVVAWIVSARSHIHSENVLAIGRSNPACAWTGHFSKISRVKISVKFNKKIFVKKWCALGEINWNDSGFQMYGIQIVTVSVFLFRNFSLVFLSIDVRSVTKTKKKETTAAKKKKKKETKSRMTIRKKAGDKNRPRAEKNYRGFRIFDNSINMCGLSTICTTVISVPVI